jgi:hypothetical protein
MSRFQITRADIGAMARAAARQMQALRVEQRRRELSGEIAKTTSDTAPTISVIEEPLPSIHPGGPPRVKWTSISTPWDMPEVCVSASQPEADANGISLHALLEKRARRLIRNRLAGAEILDKPEANRVARLVQFFVADRQWLVKP